MLEAGNVLAGRYRIIAFLGRGGMAEVYRAFDTVRRIDVAIKVLREDLAEDAVFLRRFEREAEALRELSHPNIVRFYDFCRDEHLAFLVMEFIDGITLRRRIVEQRGPLSSAQTVSILAPIASVLDYAHAMGYVHRDIKPGNIMIDRSGRVVVTDFGIARLIEGGTSTYARPGAPAYMSPEQCLGRDVDGRSDIYALGVTLFEMLTGGERPFTGETSSAGGSTGERIIYQHLHEEPPPPSRLNHALSPGVDAVVLCALAKDRTQRYATAGEMLDAARRALQEAHGGEGLAPPGTTSQVETEIQGVRSQLSGEPAYGRVGRDRTTRWRALAPVGALGIVALVLFLVLRPTPPPPPPITLASPGPTEVVEQSRTPDVPVATASATAVPDPGGHTATPTITKTNQPQPSMSTPTRTPTMGRTTTYTPSRTPTDRPGVTHTPTRAPTNTSAPITPISTPAPIDPPTVSFDADRSTLQAGQCATLRWEVRNANAVYLGDKGVAGNSSEQVCPTSTTTYRLRVVGQDGSDRQHTVQITVEQIPAPVVSFRADSTSVTQGQCTTLRWDAEHVTAVYLDGAGVGGQGSQQVCPTSTTTYRLRVVGRDSSDRPHTVQITVEQIPAPVVSFRADSTNLAQGQCTTLHWNVQHASAVYLDRSGVGGQESRQVCPTSTTTYRLRVVGRDGSDRPHTVQITVEQIPAPVVSFRADNTNLTQGQCTTLHWNVQHAKEVHLDGGGVGGQESRQVCPTSTTTYRLRVVGRDGSDREHTVQITVEQIPAPVVSFRADSTNLTQGQCTTLRWDVQHAKEVHLDGGGVSGQESRQVCPTSTTIYRLRVVGRDGSDREHAVQINVSQPPREPSVRFWTSYDAIRRGECTVLQWSVQNARSVELDGSGVSGENARQVCPGETRTYTLRVLSQTGNTQEHHVRVTVNDAFSNASRIENVNAPSSVGRGQTFTVRWSMAGDAGFHKIDWSCDPGNCTGAQDKQGHPGSYEQNITAPGQNTILTFRIRSSRGADTFFYLGFVRVGD